MKWLKIFYGRIIHVFIRHTTDVCVMSLLTWLIAALFNWFTPQLLWIAPVAAVLAIASNETLSQFIEEHSEPDDLDK